MVTSISSDANGNFIIAWTDHRNGSSDIYAQRYSSDGTPLGNNFRVNDDSTDVIVEVYDITGQNVRTLLNKKMPAGNHRIEFKASNLASGIYFYRIQSAGFQSVKKMILFR